MATTTETSCLTYLVTADREPFIALANADNSEMRDDEAAQPDIRQTPLMTSSFPFFALPAELRTKIYEELLVSDASFRLGHHGPFCLVPRKPTYPAILRTSRRALDEAAPVLYGANSFFLGTIGFKPIYSFSFFASIGQKNAALIRKLVAHSTYPNLTTRSHLQNWIEGLGIGFARLKVLAISFETNPLELAAMPLPGPPPIGAPLQMQLPPANATLQSQSGLVANTNASTNVFVSAMGLSTTAAMAVSAATNGVQSPMASTNIASTNVWSAANQMLSSVLATQNWPSLPSTTTNVPTQNLPSAHGVLSMNATGSTTAGSVIGQVKEDAFQYEICARREQLWLQKANTRMVQEFANVPNCDLRAGDCWLLYRDPNVRKLPGME